MLALLTRDTRSCSPCTKTFNGQVLIRIMFRCPVRLPYIGLVHMLWWALFGLQCAWAVHSGHCLVCMDCAVHINLLGTSQSPASCSVHTGVPSCPATASHPEWNWFSSNLHTVITSLSQQAFATISCQISTRETQVHLCTYGKNTSYVLAMGI